MLKVFNIGSLTITIQPLKTKAESLCSLIEADRKAIISSCDAAGGVLHLDALRALKSPRIEDENAKSKAF